MSNADFVEKNYERIATDPHYRAKLLADPVGVVCAEFGYTPDPDFRIEIIEQAEDTIVIVVPPKPEAETDLEQALTEVTERVFDLLFSSGIGGFFIPDDKQKWVVREMRLAAQKKTGLDISQL
ncbi:hypothetical protein EZH22_15390 [Xanthobacter dioxanivorans]|uniref:Nitrile hydratase alpha /Thiocyanate hydrolase gamma domain-containing protein n=1 Tax=Xanthobacter dioxanivorans TaxID=2528964 RepID=A0A974PJ28_9HYPH|nr:hypothetical protein [Xanthobacter dioxanivorans]QRG04572.1 hypothetical protein EZH22_15390 [Xanthobacter dioxanivorans]